MIGALISPGFAADSPTPSNKSAPPSGVFRLGDIETTTVDVGGQQVLRIFSPTVWDRSKSGDQIPVEQRAQRIAGQLLQVITPRPLCPPPYSLYTSTPLDNLLKGLIVGDRANRAAYEHCLQQNRDREGQLIYNPRTLQVSTARLNNEVVVVASDPNHLIREKLLTVTQEDANVHGLTRETVADQWAIQLQAFLRQELINQQESSRQVAVWRTVVTALVGIVLLEVGKSWLSQRYRQRAKALTPDQDWTHPESPTPPSQLLDLSLWRHPWSWLKSAVKENEEQLLRSGLWVLGWLQIFALIDAGTAILSSTSGVLERGVALQLLTIPFKILAYLFAGRILISVILWGIKRAIAHWVLLSQPHPQEYARRKRRSKSIQAALQSVVTVVIWSVVLLFIIGVFGIKPTDILAGGALVGGVLALIFQNLLRDWVAGAFILTEDQFALGDIIRANGVEGTVAAFNLRSTQLRNLTGAWITLPNGAIQQVVNLSHYWSKAEVQIPLSADTDLSQASTLILQTLEKVCSSPAWRAKVLEPPQLLGLERFNATSATLRFQVKTQPGEQAMLQRVLRQQILTDLQAAHIGLSLPRLQINQPTQDPD
jgi:small conductance mechanosensitive channel